MTRRAFAPQQQTNNQSVNNPAHPATDATEAVIVKAHSGCMVALMLPQDIAKQLAIPGGEAPSELHVTLAYLGKAADMSESQQNAVKEIVAKLASQSFPIAGRVAGLGRFEASASSDDMDVLYASYDSPQLADLRQRLVFALTEANLPISTEHGYTPHITLAYIPAKSALPIQTVGEYELNFDSLTLAMAGERQMYKLTKDPAGPISDGDARYHEDMLLKTAAFQDKMKSLSAQLSGTSVIVMGCGDGAALEVLKEKGHSVDGIDSSVAAVTKSREKGLSVYLADAAATPYADNSYSDVVTVDMLQNSACPEAIMKEALRIGKQAVHIVTLSNDLPAPTQSWKTEADLVGWVESVAVDVSVSKTVGCVDYKGMRYAVLKMIKDTIATPALQDAGKLAPAQSGLKFTSLHDALSASFRFYRSQSEKAANDAEQASADEEKQFFTAVAKSAQAKADELAAKIEEEKNKPQGVTKSMLCPIVKADISGEKRLVYGVALQPGVTDLQGDIISAEEIEMAAHNFLAAYNVGTKLGYLHKEFDRKLELVESYIASTDFIFNGRQIRRGTWIVCVRVIDDEIWAAVKSGKVNGFSIGGVAKVRRLAA